MNRPFYTYNELYQMRLKVIRKTKCEMKKEKHPVERMKNLVNFKQLCKDRHFDTTAGTGTQKGQLGLFSGLYYYPWE